MCAVLLKLWFILRQCGLLPVLNSILQNLDNKLLKNKIKWLNIFTHMHGHTHMYLALILRAAIVNRCLMVIFCDLLQLKHYSLADSCRARF